jgi:hypothetical protein
MMHVFCMAETEFVLCWWCSSFEGLFVLPVTYSIFIHSTTNLSTATVNNIALISKLSLTSRNNDRHCQTWAEAYKAVLVQWAACPVRPLVPCSAIPAVSLGPPLPSETKDVNSKTLRPFYFIYILYGSLVIFFIRIVGGGVHTGSTRHVGHWMAYCTCPRRLWWWRIWWNEGWQGKPKHSEKTCSSATLSTTNPTWPDPGSNSGSRGGKPATNRLSYGAAWCFGKLVQWLSQDQTKGDLGFDSSLPHSVHTSSETNPTSSDSGGSFLRGKENGTWRCPLTSS